MAAKLAGEELEDLCLEASKVDGEMINLQEQVDHGEAVVKICLVVGAKPHQLEAMEQQPVMIVLQLLVMVLVEDMPQLVKVLEVAMDNNPVAAP